MRKIIQIAATHQSRMSDNLFLYALCSDGTVWVLENNGKCEWQELPAVPAAPKREITINDISPFDGGI